LLGRCGKFQIAGRRGGWLVWPRAFTKTLGNLIKAHRAGFKGHYQLGYFAAHRACSSESVRSEAAVQLVSFSSAGRKSTELSYMDHCLNGCLTSANVFL